MKTIFTFGSFIIFVFILGSLLAYPVYELVQAVFSEGSYIAEKPFGKVANRCYILAALIGIHPLWKALKCNNKTDLGFAIPKKEFFPELRIGLLFGFLSLAVLAILIISLDLRVFEDDIEAFDVVKSTIRLILSAFVIGIIEEVFFRGILLRSMSRSLSPAKAIILISLIFATIHFLRNKTNGVVTEINWLSGFVYLNSTFANYSDPTIIGSWFTLFSCSVFLSFLSLHHGNIARCIGVHAGWVIIIGLIKKFTDDNESSPHYWLLGSYDHITGYLAFFIITLISFSFWFIKYRPSQKAPTE
jgi:uncharacterized protein